MIFPCLGRDSSMLGRSNFVTNKHFMVIVEKMKKILITGVDGLLGRHVCKLCVQRGWEVFGISHRSETNWESDWKRIIVDLKEPWEAGTLPEKVNSVVHLAQSNHYRDFPDHADDLFGVNVAATARLLNYARRVGAEQFIYASTGGVYSPGPVNLNENSPIYDMGKLGAYFGSKVCGEILVQNYAPYMTTTILRPFFIYGPGQKRNVHLPRIFDNIRSGRAIQLQGEHGISMNPIHVADAAQAVTAAIKTPLGSVVNIAGAEALTIRQIAKGFGSYLGSEPIFEIIPSEPQSLVADISLMCAKLHEPKIRLLESIIDVSF